MGAPAPTFIPAPFASEAEAGYINFPIPESAPANPPNSASWVTGFPPITMQTEVAGGLPPFGQDYNGILLTLSQHTYAQQAGQPYTFSASFAGTISGYAAGAMLGMADGTGTWLNTSDGNTTNPDTAAAPSGWVPGISYGITYVTGLAGGVVTLTPAQTRRQVIELSGALISNLTIVLPPTLQQWLIVNNTTGAFTTTVTTASGAGVVVPQGGPSSPLGVWGDGTNLYPTVAPLTVPISQDATPLTLVERTNTGYIFGTYFNQSSALENPAVGAVVVQNSAADGYFRKISLAGFAAQIAPAVLNSAALTGTPTAPTAASGTSNGQVASTAFANPGAAIAGTSGYQKLPGGLILQGGTYGPFTNGTFRVAFPTAFPGGVLAVVTDTLAASGIGGAGSWEQFVTAQDAGGFNFTSTGVTSAGVYATWIALGY